MKKDTLAKLRRWPRGSQPKVQMITWTFGQVQMIIWLGPKARLARFR